MLPSVAATSETHRSADMEVAGQWRREWAGTAEYGKVTEGGVTRRVARAMEVLNASAPGARVRVVRAAYHSSAGPGATAASCLMHSSRRVISSGFNLLESPSFPSKPLEISSTPLESFPESTTDVENYKVTEPDDFDISEPSKWKSSIGGSSMRMPSEESSSTDNASIIDLDSRTNHKSIFRKHSYDSENSDTPSTRRNSTRASPLLDAPVALSTLKYKSLLNGSNDWNNRRKSYSFEDTSPLDETVMHNDTLAMESSTDSGICKSSELVDDTDDKSFDRKERKYDKHEGNFKDWLFKNRPSSFYKPNQMRSYREHDVVVEHPLENNITLQSSGKVSITVPITVEIEDDYQYKKDNASDEAERRIKKVEFCKTELHFAAESGKVNIIATDEKPPPSNDFRKRRSAFVPIHGNFEKPITLFGDNNKDINDIGIVEFPTFTNGENGDFDENTAATKSILKNKIPKPKPYLLGENMVFGRPDNLTNHNEERMIFETNFPTAVTLINRQLQSERRYSDEATFTFSNETDTGVIKDNTFRTNNRGPSTNDSLKHKKNTFEIEETTASNHIEKTRQNTNERIKNKHKSLQMSPVPVRAKTRQLRDSDLTYFGIDKGPQIGNEMKPKYESSFQSESGINDFHSVRLVQHISNSVCNSEAESDDTPEYQNIPIKTNFAPVPTPRSRSKVQIKPEMIILKPVMEQESDSNDTVSNYRRSRLRRQDEIVATSNRSISEPPKFHSKEKSTTRTHQRFQVEKDYTSPRMIKHYAVEGNNEVAKSPIVKIKTNANKDLSEESDPLYVNFSVKDRKSPTNANRTNSSHRRTDQRKQQTNGESNKNNSEIKIEKIKSHRNRNYDDKQAITAKSRKERTNTDSDKDSLQKKQNSLKNKNYVQRTEKRATPDYSSENQQIKYDKLSINNLTTDSNHVEEQNTSNKLKQDHRSRSSQRNLTTSETRGEDDLKSLENIKELKLTAVPNEVGDTKDIKHHTRNSSKDKVGGRKEHLKTPKKLDNNSPNSKYDSTKSRNKVLNTTERIPNTDNYKLSKRSEYVINYDDKNGTVSSICKVKLDPVTSKRKKIPKEITKDRKENITDHKDKNKTAEKIALLQLPDRHWDPNRLNNADKKRKRKMHVQRTCQLL